ncbi:PTS system mannose/fructose/sorbose family transporter subunit IID, partial [Escherichia coli]|uniref:PTS system mannose/fructose/sorbose family transporter subunit IID n=1 Tax=Escherichia coli TaxID=562 RepID=UPI003EBC9B3C
MGLIMMGALSASFVKITSPLKISALKGSEVVVQQILDSIAPGLLPLGTATLPMRLLPTQVMSGSPIRGRAISLCDGPGINGLLWDVN